jgi:LPXTG-site transpeptidase (sortase) family protein
MARKALKRSTRRKIVRRKKNGALKASVVVYLAIVFLPWSRAASFDALVLRVDAASGQAGSMTVAAALPTPTGAPLRLKIPSIKVDAAIEHVAIKKDGSMDTPKLPKNTAWYKLGPKPGEIGSAVIAGHVNWWNGAVSAFANLNKVKIGDKVYVQNDKGEVVTFTVRKIRRLDVAADATDVFISTDGKAHLNLVTCIGVWNKKTRQYSQRLIVFADRDQ